MIHTGEKPYACTICEKKTQTIEHFKKTWQEPFACSFCDKKFVEHSKAKQHEMIHTGEEPSVLNKNWSFFKRLMI